MLVFRRNPDGHQASTSAPPTRRAWSHHYTCSGKSIESAQAAFNAAKTHSAWRRRLLWRIGVFALRRALGRGDSGVLREWVPGMFTPPKVSADIAEVGSSRSTTNRSTPAAGDRTPDLVPVVGPPCLQGRVFQRLGQVGTCGPRSPDFGVAGLVSPSRKRWQ